MTAEQMNKIDFMLVTSSPYKFDGLQAAVQAIPSHRLPKLSLDRVGLRAEKCPVDIPEENGWRAEYLFRDKGNKTREAMGDHLQVGEVGLTGDVNPRLGEPGSRLSVTLTKYARPQNLARYDQAEPVLAEYIASHFGRFKQEKDILLLLEIGLVPWVASGIIGLVKQKLHTYFGRNPLPDAAAAKDYLQYCAETHLNKHGDRDNTNLERNLYAAGGVMHRDLIAWAVHERGIPVEVYGRGSDAYAEVGQLARGFTPEAMEIVLEMGRATLASGRSLAPKGDRYASLWPNKHNVIVWSPTEQHCVSRKG